MEHKNYIDKKLKELIEDTPNYAIGYYFVILNGKVFDLRDVLKNENILNKTISNISDLHSDYSYDIEVE